jgi:hypothetical protein
MSRTSIPVDEATKERLDAIKREDETWDEFLQRTALSDEPITTGFLSEEGSAAVRETIAASRDSF